jgi:hypothetical protein
LANEKLKVGGEELKLPAKKAKDEKKSKWQAKTGKKVKAEPVVEVTEVAHTVDETPALPPPMDFPDVAMAAETSGAEPVASEESATTTEFGTPLESTFTGAAPSAEPVTSEEPTTKKPCKLKLQVFQDRKFPMTCPELIDLMATEGFWASPGGKAPAATLYAALSRNIKDFGEEFAVSEVGAWEV